MKRLIKLKLLSFTSNKNQKFIENCKNYYNGYNIFGCIHLYKKYYKDDEELKFFAKLALVIIYDDIINNEKKLNNLKDDIKDYIKNYNDE
jgi:hypothetical protein